MFIAKSKEVSTRQRVACHAFPCNSPNIWNDELIEESSDWWKKDVDIDVDMPRQEALRTSDWTCERMMMTSQEGRKWAGYWEVMLLRKRFTY